jgi:hypothetical protein
MVESLQRKKSNRPQFVFILGMHRSGTSCLTGALEACGLHLERVSRTNRDNARGNLEPRRVRKINDQILSQNHGSWHEPPDPIVVTAAQKELISEYLMSLLSSHLTGIKDPRISIIPEPWFDCAGSFQIVGTFRNPMIVALSLQKRNGFSIEKGLQLWAHYNSRILRLHSLYRFPLIEYDLTEYEWYCEKVGVIARSINLTENAESIRKFVSQDLQSFKQIPVEIPDSCRDLYLTLKSAAL